MLPLRPAAASDHPFIVALMNRAYRGTGPNASWNTEAVFLEGDRTSETGLQDELASHPNAHFLVTENEGKIQGCVLLDPRANNIWYFGSLTVDPLLQKSGLGRQLLAAAEHFAKSHGATSIQMNVINVRDTLIAWYERRGYHLTGASEAFPYGNTRFGKPLRDDLSFLTLEKPL